MPRTKTRGVVLAEHEIDKLRELVHQLGEDGAAKTVEVSPNTLVRAIGGLTLNRSTANGIRAQLDRMA